MKPKEIKIDGTVFVVFPNLETMSFREYIHAQKIRSKPIIREEKYNGKILKRELKWEEANEDERVNKISELCAALSDIPKDYFAEFDDLRNLVGSWIDLDISKIEPNPKLGKYLVRDFDYWTFGQFADFMDNNRKDPCNGFIVALSQGNKKYDPFQPDYKEKSLLFDQPAIQALPSYLYLQSNLRAYYEFFPFLFKLEAKGEKASAYMQKHYELFGWQDTVITLAETNAFSSPKGTMHGVKTARAYDVLSYLDIKRSKENALYLEQKDKK
jgi:hypothetical protein